ncbi:MAG: hypothetical protein KDC25_13945 [Saprospiraceae bacterium]|jgi:hypothetical protein|nr:hypothetical protein [Saprospiraceae bacterium]
MSLIKCVFLLLSIHFTIPSTAQMEIYHSIKKATEIAQNEKKKLIILRTEFRMIEYSKRSGYLTSEGKIDQVVKTSQFQQALKNDFLISSYDQEESSIEDQQFVKGKYFYNFTPNIIILDSKLNSLAYIPLSMYEDSNSLDKIIQSSLSDFSKDSKEMKYLEDAFKKKSIGSDELIRLIKLRANLYLRSKDYWNYFTTTKAPLPKQIEFASETYLKEDFSIHDAFFKFLMEADESYNDIKSSMVSNLKELREMENDIESYQYLNSIGDSLMINMFSQDGEISGFLNTMFPDWQDGMEEANTLKMIEMHSKAGNDSLLIITAKRHVDSILEGYEEKVKSIKIGQIAKLEFFKEALMINPPPTDTIFNWEDYKNQSIESVVSSLNRDYSNELNQICWYYYEIVDNKDALLEAIAWCQESIRLNSVKENNDTMAHLYMKSGDKSKAIEYQTIALEIAKKEGLDPEQIKYYSDELEKFKAR